MPVPMPNNITPDRRPPIRARSAPQPTVPFVPLQAQAMLAPVPFVSSSGQRQDATASESNESSIPALGGPGGDSRRIIALLEEIARGPSRQSQLDDVEQSPLDGPVYWNGSPMEQDNQGNSVLRRR